MEGMMRKQQNYVANTTSPHALYLHKNSKIIAKLKPNIRIIHIFPPKIIKTDVANFRGLVQRLTGKPTSDLISEKKVIRTTRLPSWFRVRIKGEEEILGNGIITQNNGGFLGDFADLDDFMQDLSHFQMLPMDASSI